MKAKSARLLALIAAWSGATLCSAKSNLVIWIEPLGGGWYLFKTT